MRYGRKVSCLRTVYIRGLTNVTDFVRITPIISRHNGQDMVELGAGGGQSDLDQRHELQFWDPEQVGQLIALCSAKLNNQPQLLTGILQLLTSVMSGNQKSIKLNDFMSSVQIEDHDHTDLEELPLEKLVQALAKTATNMDIKKAQSSATMSPSSDSTSRRPDGLPKQIVSRLYFDTLEANHVLDVSVLSSCIVRRAVPSY